jgi:xanthine dehydrogenase accessory factor
MKPQILERLIEDRARKRPVVLVTEIASGAQALVYPDEALGELMLDREAMGVARRALAADESGTVEAGGKRYFLHVQNPPLRLILVGAVHIAQALAPMAGLAGYAVTVVDPRRAFATDARFPDMTLIAEWPDEAMARMTLDRRTAIVTLTHDPKLDDPALQTALKSDAFYVGALGSKRTHAKRLERLKEAGLSDAQCARIHGPVGLDVGALSPAEIAVSILAQITAVLRGTKEEKAQARVA